MIYKNFFKHTGLFLLIILSQTVSLKAENISNICTLAAEKVFSLQTGVQSYKEIYETLN